MVKVQYYNDALVPIFKCLKMIYFPLDILYGQAVFQNNGSENGTIKIMINWKIYRSNWLSFNFPYMITNKSIRQCLFWLHTGCSDNFNRQDTYMDIYQMLIQTNSIIRHNWKHFCAYTETLKKSYLQMDILVWVKKPI